MAKQSTELSLDVLKLIDYLSYKNRDSFSIDKITLLVIMYVYSYERPIFDLINILNEYPHLENKKSIVENFYKLIEIGFLEVKSSTNINLCFATKDLPNKLSILFEDNNIEGMLIDARKNQENDSCAIFLGSVSNNNYISLINRFLYAQDEICLTFLNTEAYPDMVDVLKRRAFDGIKIRILLANKSIVEKYRKSYQYNVKNWVDIFDGNKNVEIRTYKRIKDLELCSSVIFDKSILRLVVFDPLKEKSSLGTLIEFHKKSSDLNIISMFYDKYNETWDRAEKINESKFTRIVKSKIV